MSEDESRVDEVVAHGRVAQNEEPTEEGEDDEVEAHARLDAPKLDAPKLD